MSGLIAAGVVAAGAVGGALISANASQQAAGQQSALGYAALNQQQNMFNTAQGALSPYYTAGQQVLPTLQSLLTPGVNQQATLEQLPGFQFASQYGTKAATNALAASGKASGGPLATAVSNYNQGLAGTQFGNFVNQIQGFVNTGANAASSVAGNAVNSANGQASTLTGIGGAQASGTLGSANALSGGLTGATGGISNALLLNSLLKSNGGIYSNSGSYISPSGGSNSAEYD